MDENKEFEKGGISVTTENIFPVIKKWLYSDKDIFVREVLSNACDAITKHSRLVSLGEAAESETPYSISIAVDKDERTITIRDNGIGMSADEVKKYINQIALSGALDFISKYEGENSADTGIIGHFGLGFYSIFMVAERAEMTTKSYVDGENAVLWECDESGSFSMKSSDRTERGTEIVMHISDDELVYLDKVRLRGILDKYCAFMPYEIHFVDGEKGEDGAENDVVINDTNPLWQRPASELTDDDYKAFYKKVFGDYRDPLMWVHINADYPLNFKGVLFFPQRRNDFEPVESELKLFYNSVFVADNIKEACPDYIINLKGVLDCPELPLNVSRSYLQNNVYINKVSAHIAKKIADKLCAMFGSDREGYEQIWSGIKPFIEYACLRDTKFYERAGKAVIFRLADGGYCTVEEYMNGAEEGTVYYASDLSEQGYYLNIFKEKGTKVLVCDMGIDVNYLSFLESKNEKIKFMRIDSDLGQEESNEKTKKEKAKLEEAMKAASHKESLEVKLVSLGEKGSPALVTISEQDRRMADMMKQYRMSAGEDIGETEDMFPTGEALTLNISSPMVIHLEKLLSEKDEKAEKTARHIYLTAVMLSRRLTPAEAEEYVELNNSLMI